MELALETGNTAVRHGGASTESKLFRIALY